MENVKNFGLLITLLDNCIFAYDQFCRINKELNEEQKKIQKADFSSDVDIKNLQAMNTIIQDYLILRVYGLFDKTEYIKKGGIDEAVSFEKIFSSNEDYKKIKEEEIIKYIIYERHNFVAHINEKFEVPVSSKICDSNLKELLINLRGLLNN